MHFSYKLSGYGWATVMVDCGNGPKSFHSSYTFPPALECLASAAVALKRGEDNASAIFVDEPGEMDLVFNRRERDPDGNDLQYDVRWYKDGIIYGCQRKDDFESIHIGRTTVESFIQSVMRDLEEILEEYGREKYEEEWSAEFPIDDLHELQGRTDSRTRKTKQSTFRVRRIDATQKPAELSDTVWVDKNRPSTGKAYLLNNRYAALASSDSESE